MSDSQNPKKQLRGGDSKHAMGELHRRAFLLSSASGLGGVALNHMLAGASSGPDGFSTLARPPHFAHTAKRCIFVFMAGAPSQLDLFDYKPMLNQYDGKPLPDSMTEGVRFAFLQKDSARLMGTKRTFKRRGQSGICLLYTSPSPRDLSTSRMPSSA